MKLGDAFPDGGFRLGVIDALLCAGTPPNTDQAFDAAAAKAKAELAEDGELDLDDVQEEVLKLAVDALAAVEVTPEQLASITHVQFDGGNDVYCFLLLEELSSRLECEEWELDTGGESEVFDVLSLEGAKHLSGLTHIDFDGHGGGHLGHDLTPFAGHPSLQELSSTRVKAGAEALLGVSTLTTLRGVRELPDAVAAELRARGVSIG